MEVYAVKTCNIKIGDNLDDILNTYLNDIEEKSIIVITSKIVSLCEGSVVSIPQASQEEIKSFKYNLIMREAEYYIDANESAYGVMLTIKNGRMLPSAGVDESNVEDGYYVLHPKDVQASAVNIWHYLRSRFAVNDVGVLITDSTVQPFRYGSIGIALGWCGFRPLHDYRGSCDCYGRQMLITMANHIDGLAAAAVHTMGEGAESTPIAVIKSDRMIQFTSETPTVQEIAALHIPIKDDLYEPIIAKANWKKCIHN